MVGQPSTPILNSGQRKECCFLHAHIRAPFTDEHPTLLPIGFLRVSDSQVRENREALIEGGLSLISRAFLPTGNGSLVSWQVFPLFSFRGFFFLSLSLHADSLRRRVCLSRASWTPRECSAVWWSCSCEQLLPFLPRVQFSWSEIQPKQFQICLCGFFCLNSVLLWVPRAQLVTDDFTQTHFAVWRLTSVPQRKVQGAFWEPCEGTKQGGHWIKWHIWH